MEATKGLTLPKLRAEDHWEELVRLVKIPEYLLLAGWDDGCL